MISFLLPELDSELKAELPFCFCHDPLCLIFILDAQHSSSKTVQMETLPICGDPSHLDCVPHNVHTVCLCCFSEKLFYSFQPTLKETMQRIAVSFGV